MDEQSNNLKANNSGGPAVASYEAPRLTAIGNLRDILAGSGSQPCEGVVTAPATGGNTAPPSMDGNCAPE